MTPHAGKEQETLGLIAGAGRFPFMVVEGAQRAGLRMSVVGLRGLTDKRLARQADAFHWSGVVRLGRWIRVLKRTGARRVIFAGSVRKSDMYARFRWFRQIPDVTSLRLWFRKVKDRRNDSIFAAVVAELRSHGIDVESSVAYCADDLAPEGVLTRRQPDERQLRDADFGWQIAKEMGRLDVGQSVAVKEQEVIAVEAIEGTDRMMQRVKELCPKGGWALVKVAKPDQDMRFDVPTVGPDTITRMKANGANLLVIEAHKTLIIDRDQMVTAADQAKIVILARTETVATA